MDLKFPVIFRTRGESYSFTNRRPFGAVFHNPFLKKEARFKEKARPQVKSPSLRVLDLKLFLEPPSSAVKKNTLKVNKKLVIKGNKRTRSVVSDLVIDMLSN
jgi:hypothetical protein